jgi:hypothetical protein
MDYLACMDFVSNCLYGPYGLWTMLLTCVDILMDYASDMCEYSGSWWTCWWYLVEYMFVSYCDVLLSRQMLVKQVKLLRIFSVIRSS